MDGATEDLIFTARSYERARDFGGAVPAWKHVFEADPEKVDFTVKGLMRCCMALDDFTELTRFYESAESFSEARASVVAALPGPARKDFEVIPEAFLEKLFWMEPSSQKLFFLYYSRLCKEKKFDAALAVQKSNARAGDSTPHDLMSEISAIERNLEVARGTPKLRAFWEICDKPFDDFETWLRRASWNRDANHIVNLFVRPVGEDRKQVMAQLRDITVPIDVSLIENAQKRGKGLIIAASHVGSVLGQAAILDDHFDKCRVIGGFPRVRPTSVEEDVFIRVNPRAAMKTIQESLGQNEILACAPDSVHLSDSKRYFDSSFGPLPMQTLVARQVYKSGCSSISSNIAWENGKLRFYLESLPKPENGESQSAFIKRWCEAYLDHHCHNLKTRMPDLNYAHVVGRG